MSLLKGFLMVVVLSCIAAASAIGMEVGGNYGMYKWIDSYSSLIGWKDGNLWGGKIAVNTSRYSRIGINYNYWKSELSSSEIINGNIWESKVSAEWQACNVYLEGLFLLKYRITPYIRAGLGIYKSEILERTFINNVETDRSQSKPDWHIGFNYSGGLQVKIFWLIKTSIGISWHTLPETSKKEKRTLRNIYFGLSVGY